MPSSHTPRRMLALALAGGALIAARPAPDAAWPMAGRDAAGQHYAAIDQINAATLDRLGLAFEFRDFVVRGRTHRGTEATPLMIDGVLYFSGPWGVAYAVDARTGRHLWTYDPDADGEAARKTCCDAVNRGVAVAGGRLFVAATDGKLAAVDIHSGKALWTVDTIADHRWNTTSTGAPIVAGHLVIIGNAGADMGSRGYASAYDTATGRLAWRFWVVPGDPRAGADENPDVTFARATWPRDTRWDLGMGGNPWDGLAYDAETDTVFIATGNGGPHPVWLRSASGRTGDELYLSSIVALDARTGRRKWHYQTTPADSWDYAATSPLVMADLPVGDRVRKVIMQAPKNGFFYMLDRQTGELLQARPYTAVNWASGIDPRTGRPIRSDDGDYHLAPRVVWPSMAGGHAWAPMAFSPRTGLVYLPVFDVAASYAMNAAGRFLPGTADHGTHNAFAPFDDPALAARYRAGPSQAFEGRLKAWDPVTGTARWTSAALPMLNGGTLVAGDLVFQGGVDGVLRVHDAASGTVLREIPIGSSILAAPMTYRLDGVQYIAFEAGFGGPQGGFFAPGSAPARYDNFERLVVLRLDGAAIPLPPPHHRVPAAPIPQPLPAGADEIAQGQRLFQEQCARCHMMGGADGIYPDLWNMDQATIDSFEAIVGGGALAYAGMGNFSSSMTATQIHAVKAFIVNDTILKRRNGAEAGAHYREATH
jgi:quinohemoprotein ethanol dehydrogenase